MRGHVRHRGEERAGSWEYIVDVGLAAAQRCKECGKRVLWVERRPMKSCPKCGGELRETEERRRETKAGFATHWAALERRRPREREALGAQGAHPDQG